MTIGLQVEVEIDLTGYPLVVEFGEQSSSSCLQKAGFDSHRHERYPPFSKVVMTSAPHRAVCWAGSVGA